MSEVRQILEDVFTERKKATIRGRAKGLRRPKRAEKQHYLGRATGMRGRDLSGEPEAPKVPGAKEEPWKKERITEFESPDDWMLSMILVAIMHANPGIKPEDAIKIGKEWVKKLYLPRTDYLWRMQMVRLNRTGIRAEASKIRRELFKVI